MTFEEHCAQPHVQERIQRNAWRITVTVHLLPFLAVGYVAFHFICKYW